MSNLGMEVVMGSTYKLWSKRLEGDLISKGQIRQWCNAIAVGAQGFLIGGMANNLTPDECAELVAQFDARVEATGGYKLESTHTAQGLRWARLNPRLAAMAGIPPQSIEDGRFIEYRWVGTEVTPYDGLSVRAHADPIYRIIWDGGTFDYSWSPWRR